MTWYTLLPIVALISLLSRLTAFVVGKALLRFPFVHKLSLMLPYSLLVLITAYSMSNVSFTESPYGLPELLALCGIVIAQTLFRAITISLITGVLLHQILRVIFLTS